MNSRDAKAIFEYLAGLWPKWVVGIPEQTEWGKIFTKMDEAFARTAISEFFQDFGRYDRPAMPDFLATARNIWRAQQHKSQGILFQIKRMSDGYCSPFMVYGTDDPDRLMSAACRQRDAMIAQYGGEWQVVRPDENPKDCIALTKENKAKIDQEIMNGPDCLSKTFLLARYCRLADSELKSVGVARPKSEYYPDGELVRYLSDGTKAPKRNSPQPVSNAVNDFAKTYKL
jgi:hypothetical protein